MAKSRQQKQKTVEELSDLFTKSKSVVFSNFDKVNVTDLTNLRNACRKQDARYYVAKKTLLALACKNAGLELDVTRYEGQVATVFGLADEVTAAKVLSEFKKTHEGVKFLGGILENREITIEVLENLARLPARQELIASVVGSIRAPLSGLVGVLSANVRSVVHVLQQIQEKKTQ